MVNLGEESKPLLTSIVHLFILIVIANIGFFIVVATFLLIRKEAKLEKLIAAITSLAKVAGELNGLVSRSPTEAQP